MNSEELPQGHLLPPRNRDYGRPRPLGTPARTVSISDEEPDDGDHVWGLERRGLGSPHGSKRDDGAQTVGTPGDRQSDAINACVPALCELLRKDLLAKGAPGSVLLVSGTNSWTAGEGPVQLVLEAEPFELIRILGSRRSERQMRAFSWTTPDGSAADIGPWLAFLAHFPYPAADLVE